MFPETLAGFRRSQFEQMCRNIVKENDQVYFKDLATV